MEELGIEREGGRACRQALKPRGAKAQDARGGTSKERRLQLIEGLAVKSLVTLIV
ncbi:MAG: hypothetical protein WC788_06855 [Candidatus Paceibacterota bacterium]